ncbi:MAG: hypothetical protein ACK4K9_03475 [Bacteroidia bacterium]
MKILFLLVALSCNKTEKQPLVSVYGKNLYLEDLTDNFNESLSESDSVLLLKRLVDDWTLNQLKLNLAKEYKSEKIENLVNDYQNSLLIHEFINDYVSNNLDTNITISELQTYFNDNRQNFLLTKNILKLVFVKVEEDNKQIVKIKNQVAKTNENNITQLAALCENNVVNYFLDYSIWLDFDDVIKEIPIKTYDVEHFLQNNRFVEIKDGNYWYFVKILDYKIKNTESEFEFEKDNIKKVLLNSRKIKLEKQLESELLNEAKNNNQIKSYIYE